MGGFDSYCVFCGALAGEPYVDAESEEDYDPDISTEQDRKWMASIRVTGKNAKCPSISKYVYGASSPYTLLRN